MLGHFVTVIREVNLGSYCPRAFWRVELWLCFVTVIREVNLGSYCPRAFWRVGLWLSFVTVIREVNLGAVVTARVLSGGWSCGYVLLQ